MQEVSTYLFHDKDAATENFLNSIFSMPSLTGPADNLIISKMPQFTIQAKAPKCLIDLYSKYTADEVSFILIKPGK